MNQNKLFFFIDLKDFPIWRVHTHVYYLLRREGTLSGKNMATLEFTCVRDVVRFSFQTASILTAVQLWIKTVPLCIGMTSSKLQEGYEKNNNTTTKDQNSSVKYSLSQPRFNFIVIQNQNTSIYLAVIQN